MTRAGRCTVSIWVAIMSKGRRVVRRSWYTTMEYKGEAGGKFSFKYWSQPWCIATVGTRTIKRRCCTPFESSYLDGLCSYNVPSRGPRKDSDSKWILNVFDDIHISLIMETACVRRLTYSSNCFRQNFITQQHLNLYSQPFKYNFYSFTAKFSQSCSQGSKKYPEYSPSNILQGKNNQTKQRNHLIRLLLEKLQ